MTKSYYSYDRLSDSSAACLLNENARSFAHYTFIHTFESGPLATEDGGVDFASIREAIATRLHLVPRLRQELRWIPFENHPVWVDDQDLIRWLPNKAQPHDVDFLVLAQPAQSVSEYTSMPVASCQGNLYNRRRCPSK